jgi:chromate transporter
VSYLLYFWLFLKASLFSTGGMGNLPSLHADLLHHHWATERQFTESLTIGQLAPGPNGLWVISLGYLSGGWLGAMLALVAINIPPFLVLLVERIYRSIKDLPAIEGFIHGISLAVSGVSIVVFMGLLQNEGINFRSASIAIGSFCLGMTRRIPILVILAIAALAGIVVQ